jgi:hypothetical protein
MVVVTIRRLNRVRFDSHDGCGNESVRSAAKRMVYLPE